MRNGSITLSIDSTFDNVYLIGLAVSRICAAVANDAVDPSTFELCVIEAVNNVIEHAYAGEPGHPVDVTLSIAGDRLTCAICDTGRTMDWEAACRRAEQLPEEEDLAEGGRGLYIMQTLMDEISYCREGDTNVLTLTKRFSPAHRR